jgi:hypothetical protein
MSETLSRLFNIHGVPITKTDLVVVPQPPTPATLAADIRKGQAEVEKALLNAVSTAIGIGKALREAKRLVGHGNFEDFVAVECRCFTMRTAQNYMRLAKYEAQLAQLLAGKNEGRSYLTMNEAFKFIDKLKRRRKG